MTQRGAGLHHSSGCPSEYQGKSRPGKRPAAAADAGRRPRPASPLGEPERLAGRGKGCSGITAEPRQVEDASHASSRRYGSCCANCSRYSSIQARSRSRWLDMAARKPFVAHVVKGPRLPRQEAAADLVLALRAGLEHVDAVADAVFDTLVVRRLEMQARQLLDATPVAAVKTAPPARNRLIASGSLPREANAPGRNDRRARWRCWRKTSASAPDGCRTRERCCR